MDNLKTFYDWLIMILGLREFFEIVNAGDYKLFFTGSGLAAIIRPLFPILIILEILKAAIYRKFKAVDYKIPFFSLVLRAFIERFISLHLIIFCFAVFGRFAILETSFTWYWFIYGYIVWELAHFIYHYLGHKVRLFWCIHSTHHTPETMNLSVNFAQSFLNEPYADLIRTTICILFGLNPMLVMVIMVLDGVWGAFIHIGEHMLKDGKLGFLHRFILTPSHHRVHHAKNPLYMDTNFCNFLPIWDKLFKTYQPEVSEIKVEYGITRPMRPNSFIDAYFGEFWALIKDVKRAPGIRNKLLYFVMPPGWSHTGEHKTAKKIRDEYLQPSSQGYKSENNTRPDLEIPYGIKGAKQIS